MRKGLTGVLVLAALLSGCGSSSRSASHGGVTGSSATFVGTGFQLTYPGGWSRPTRTGSPGAITGAAITAPDGRATIAVHSYPHSARSIIELLRDVATTDAAEEQVGQIRVRSNALQTPSIPGAAQTKELIQTFDNRAGRQRLRELLVMTPSGTLIDVEAVASEREVGFDPAAVIASFRLT